MRCPTLNRPTRPAQLVRSERFVRRACRRTPTGPGPGTSMGRGCPVPRRLFAQRQRRPRPRSRSDGHGEGRATRPGSLRVRLPQLRGTELAVQSMEHESARGETERARAERALERRGQDMLSRCAAACDRTAGSSRSSPGPGLRRRGAVHDQVHDVASRRPARRAPSRRQEPVSNGWPPEVDRTRCGRATRRRGRRGARSG